MKSIERRRFGVLATISWLALALYSRAGDASDLAGGFAIGQYDHGSLNQELGLAKASDYGLVLRLRRWENLSPLISANYFKSHTTYWRFGTEEPFSRWSFFLGAEVHGDGPIVEPLFRAAVGYVSFRSVGLDDDRDSDLDGAALSFQAGARIVLPAGIEVAAVCGHELAKTDIAYDGPEAGWMARFEVGVRF